MVATLDHLRERGLIAVENGTWQIKVPLETIDLQAPESLRQLIELQIERLSEEEQRALEVASITGVSFTAYAEALRDLGTRRSLKTFAKSCRAGNTWCAGRDRISSRTAPFPSATSLHTHCTGRSSIAGSARATGEAAAAHWRAAGELF